MKRILILIILGLAIFEPQPQPVEVKPVITEQPEQWAITKAWYQKVIMPDGSRLELKSRTPLTKAQWQKLADEMWELEKNKPEPKMCPHCGQLMPEGYVP